MSERARAGADLARERPPGGADPAGARALPFWLDEPYQPRPALAGDAEVDACVIGAGVAGLSCARRLAEHGVETLVLERETVASGASGRNGGFLLAGLAPFYNDLREHWGREWARQAYARTIEAQDEMYALAGSLGAEREMRRVGLLRVSTSPEEAEHVRRHAQALAEDGFPGELVTRDQLPAAVRRFAHNGCRTDHDGALHPARWIRALARAAEQAGARIHEHTKVSAPVRAPGEGPLVATPGEGLSVSAPGAGRPAAAPGRGPAEDPSVIAPGEGPLAAASGRAPGGAPPAAGAGRVRARHVVVACDGALPLLVPEYAGRVRSRRLHMLATAPLDQRLVEELVYARFGHEYFQQRPDGRLLLGGFSDVDGERSYTASERGNPRVWERIELHLRDDLGVAAQVTHRWVGVVGYSEDGLPFAGEVPGRPGLHVAGGYSGHGNVPGYLAGREIADAIAGAASRPPLFSADR